MAPASAHSLPPSVEEAYRRKCTLLKQRTADVEETNDAVRVRLARLKRQVEKQRIERAFLLEQLAKRTSTNVEDSDGSPSPPPTPKDKPLRTKRGHRKASLTGPGEPGSSFGRAQSPNSDVASNHVDSQVQGNSKNSVKGKDKDFSKEAAEKNKDKSKTSTDGNGKDNAESDDNNGEAESCERPVSGFELYCVEKRASLEREGKKNNSKKKSGSNDEDVDMVDGENAVAEVDEEKAGEKEDANNVKEELERGWKDMTQSERDEFKARAAENLKKAEKETKVTNDADKKDSDKANGKDEVKAAVAKDDKDGKDDKSRSADRAVKSEEDVEMEDGETAADTPSGQKD